MDSRIITMCGNSFGAASTPPTTNGTDAIGQRNTFSSVGFCSKPIDTHERSYNGSWYSAHTKKFKRKINQILILLSLLRLLLFLLRLLLFLLLLRFKIL